MLQNSCRIKKNEQSVDCSFSSEWQDLNLRPLPPSASMVEMCASYFASRSSELGFISPFRRYSLRQNDSQSFLLVPPVCSESDPKLKCYHAEIKKERFCVPSLFLSDKTWTCGLYHPNGVRLVCKSANIVEYLPISLIFRGFRLLFGKYRLLKKCTRCRKNTILYQNFVPDFSAFQGFCGFCLKGLYHIFLKKSSAESYLFEN